MVERRRWGRRSVALIAMLTVILAGCSSLGQGPKAAGSVSQGIPSIDRSDPASAQVGRVVPKPFQEVEREDRVHQQQRW